MGWGVFFFNREFAPPDGVTAGVSFGGLDGQAAPNFSYSHFLKDPARLSIKGIPPCQGIDWVPARFAGVICSSPSRRGVLRITWETPCM